MRHIDPPRLRQSANGRGALNIEILSGTTIRLHWTDKPCKWHVNDGAEVFVVLHGMVDMHHKTGGSEQVTTFTPGDIFYAAEGDEHFAEPIGVARVLVVEKGGSV